MKLSFLAISLLFVLMTRAQDSSKVLIKSDTLKNAKHDPIDDVTYTKVEIEAEYPGGNNAWARYINKTLHYPENALKNEIQGCVIVQFIVEKDGTVSNVEAISGPTEGGLREESVRVVKLSGKWTCGIQNGRQVKSYKKQPICFKLVVSK